MHAAAWLGYKHDVIAQPPDPFCHLTLILYCCPAPASQSTLKQGYIVKLQAV